MKHQSSKQVEPHTDPFGPFKKATRKAFSFLAEAPYKFEAGEPIVHVPECVIEYLNKTTGVTVSYEWGGSPSVVLKRLEQSSSSISSGEQVGLKFLVMERCPSSIGEFDPEVSGDLEEILGEYARILKECGDDILRGDFQVFTKLKQIADEELRKKNTEMFGSETGESFQRY